MLNGFNKLREQLVPSWHLRLPKNQNTFSLFLYSPAITDNTLLSSPFFLKLTTSSLSTDDLTSNSNQGRKSNVFYYLLSLIQNRVRGGGDPVFILSCWLWLTVWTMSRKVPSRFEPNTSSSGTSVVPALGRLKWVTHCSPKFETSLYNIVRLHIKKKKKLNL
jgi:hypothetical protein